MELNVGGVGYVCVKVNRVFLIIKIAGRMPYSMVGFNT